MIYTALIVVCLAAAPADCRSYEQPFAGLSTNSSIAFMQAQALVANWMAEHPRFTLQRFSLEPGRGA